MNPFQIGQFHVGGLLSCLVLELARTTGIEGSAAKEQATSNDGETTTRDMRSVLSGRSPEAVLRAAERYWPSRYY